MAIYSSFLCVSRSALLSIATAVETVDRDVKVTLDKSTGDFQISLQGQEWLRSGAVTVRNQGKWWKSNSKDRYISTESD